MILDTQDATRTERLRFFIKLDAKQVQRFKGRLLDQPQLRVQPPLLRGNREEPEDSRALTLFSRRTSRSWGMAS